MANIQYKRLFLENKERKDIEITVLWVDNVAYNSSRFLFS